MTELPAMALVVKPKWATLLLEGLKTVELRGSRTNVRGTVAIAMSGTGNLVGAMQITGCRLVGHRLPSGDLVAATDGSFVGDMFQEHRVDDLTILQYRNIWAWDIRNAVAFERPIPYVHRSGAVRWVRLAETKVTAGPRSIQHPPAKASSCCTSESVALAPSSDEEGSARLTNERSLARSLGPSKPSLDSVSLAISDTDDEEASARLTNYRSSARLLCPSKRKSSGDLTLRRECKNVPATGEHMIVIFGLCCKRNDYTLCPSQAVLF